MKRKPSFATGLISAAVFVAMTFTGAAWAQTMGEYGGITAGAGTNSDKFGASTKFGPPTNFGPDHFGNSDSGYHPNVGNSNDVKSNDSQGQSNDSATRFGPSDFGTSAGGYHPGR
jgi:hypothetical protein